MFFPAFYNFMLIGFFFSVALVHLRARIHVVHLDESLLPSSVFANVLYPLETERVHNAWRLVAGK